MRLKFRLSNGKKTFFQWDVNQKIILENPICTQVHFENKDISDKAYVKEVYKDNEGRRVVDIPDIFLQYTPGFLFYGYVISEDGKERFTEERGDVSVIRRAKPSDYVFTPEDQKTLEEVFDDAVKYIPEKKTDEEKANARDNIGAESVKNKVSEIGDDDGTHYPTVGAVKAELDKKIDNPQAASIGEVLTVEEVDENGKPTKWKTAPASSGGSSAFYINITSTTDDSGDTTYSADKTADEIIAAYESGAVIIGVYGEIYIQGIVHIAEPHGLTLIFGTQEVDVINGIIYQYACRIDINKDNKEMDVLYEQNEIMLDEGIVFMVDNNTVQASGSFEDIYNHIISALDISKSINIILAKDRAVYNLSRLEGTSNGILIKFDDVANSKTYIVFADSYNEAFTYSEEDLPSGGSTGEIDPKKIPDMYYTEVGSVDIAGKIITSVTLYRSEEGVLEKSCPFELGQVWKVITDNYTSDELEVKQSSDGTLYIGDLNKGNPPFYITATSSSANPNWLSMLGVSGNAVTSLVGVSGTMSGGEIIHKIPEQYIPDVVALKNELPDMAIEVIELDNVIASPTVNIDDVDKPVLAIIKCDKNTQFKFDRVLIKTPLRERYTRIVYQSGANSENPYACMMILIKKIASSEDIFEAICLNARTKSNTILDIDNSGFENKDYYTLPDGTYNFLSTYTSNSYRIKGFTTVTNHCFKCYDTGDSITFNPNGIIASYGHAYSIAETDPTVPKWAKAATKPTYTAEEVGALPNTTVIPTVPTTLPNPHKLTFTGAVTGEYDGSSALTVDIPKGGDNTLGITTAAVGQIIKVKSVDGTGKPTEWEAADLPSGGGGEMWEKLVDTTLAEAVESVTYTFDNCKRIKALIAPAIAKGEFTSGWTRISINNVVYPSFNSRIDSYEGIYFGIDSEYPPYVQGNINVVRNATTYGIVVGKYAAVLDNIAPNGVTEFGCQKAELLKVGTKIKIWGVKS